MHCVLDGICYFVGFYHLFEFRQNKEKKKTPKQNKQRAKLTKIPFTIKIKDMRESCLIPCSTVIRFRILEMFHWSAMLLSFALTSWLKGFPYFILCWMHDLLDSRNINISNINTSPLKLSFCKTPIIANTKISFCRWESGNYIYYKAERVRTCDKVLIIFLVTCG